MAHILRVTDETTYVTFTAGDMYLVDYVPKVTRDGSYVREQATVGFTGTLTTIRSNLNVIDRLFEQAASYADNKTGPKVYIEFDPGTLGTVYRSRLYSGFIDFQEDLLGWQWAVPNIETTIEWERDPFWEGPLTVLPLSNSSTTNSITGILVNNVNDTSGENWVEITGSDVLGDVRSPIKVQLYNAYASAAPTDEFYIFHNVHSNPGSITHVLEGEDGTGAYVTTSTEGTAGASNDQYATITWSTTNEVKIAEWVLSDELVTSAGGGLFAVMVRFYGAFPYSDMWLRIKQENNSTEMWSGTLSNIPNARELQMLTSARIPTGMQGESSLKSINLSLYGKRNIAGTHAFNVDYLQLGAISAYGGWKRFKTVESGLGIAYDEYFIHDNTDPPGEKNYRIDTSGKKIEEFANFGGPIMLEPGETQRLYFMSCDQNGYAYVEQSWTAMLWYRPRRRAL